MQDPRDKLTRTLVRAARDPKNQKFPLAAELSDDIMKVFPDKSNPDENVKALLVVLAEVLCRMFETPSMRLRAADVAHKQLRAYIQIQAVVADTMKPVLERAEAEGRPVTKEEAMAAMEALRADIRQRAEAKKAEAANGNGAGGAAH